MDRRGFSLRSGKAVYPGQSVTTQKQMTYTAKNQHPHTCSPSPRDCHVCSHEDAAERAAIQTDGKPLSAYQKALQLILESRRRGQRVMLAG